MIVSIKMVRILMMEVGSWATQRVFGGGIDRTGVSPTFHLIRKTSRPFRLQMALSLFRKQHYY